MKALILWVLRLYKRWISPSLPPSCRYVPTCCEYAIEAVERYGAARGGCLAVGRLLRCHPFVKGGYDPVVKTGEPQALAPSRWRVDSSAAVLRCCANEERPTIDDKPGYCIGRV